MHITAVLWAFQDGHFNIIHVLHAATATVDREFTSPVVGTPALEDVDGDFTSPIMRTSIPGPKSQASFAIWQHYLHRPIAVLAKPNPQRKKLCDEK